MKRRRQLVLSVLLMAVLVLTIAIPAFAKPKISKKKATITVGQTLKLKVTNGKKAKWSSSNKKIATVNKKGNVTGKQAGKVVITAKVGSKKLKCKITVKEAASTPTPAPVVVPDPVVTPTPVEGPSTGEVTYVCNTNTKKFHLPDCSSVRDIAPHNRLDTSESRNALIANGYEPCKRCHP